MNLEKEAAKYQKYDEIRIGVSSRMFSLDYSHILVQNFD